MAAQRRGTMASVAIAVSLLGACTEVVATDPSGGQPLGPESLTALDAATVDGYESPRRTGRVPDARTLPDAPPGVDAGDAGGGGVDEAGCIACLEEKCRDTDGVDYYAYCLLTTERAMDGTPRSVLCRAVLHCALVTGCVEGSAQPCYCGAGVSDIDCLAGRAAGPCIPETEAAAESRSAAVIAERSADPAYALGAAWDLINSCAVSSTLGVGPCHAVCSGGGGGQPDAGAPPDAPIPPADAPPPRPDAGVTSCADLDEDGRPDCGETLLANPRFDVDVSSWTVRFGATQRWDPARDGLASSASGSLAVTNAIVADASGTTMMGTSQCVPATAGTTYTVAAQIYLPPGQGAGLAGLNLAFFPSAGCAAASSKIWTSTLISQTDRWTTISGSTAAPAGASSVLVRPVVQKPFRAPPFTANFDNLLLRGP